MKLTHRINPFLLIVFLFGMVALIEACAYIRIPAAIAPVSTLLPTDIPSSTFISPQEKIQRLAATPTSIPSASPAPSEPPASAYQPITWMELVDFLAKDHTNWNPYIPGKYTCLNFSVDLVANAEKQDIKAWVVLTEFSNNSIGHAFVGFETTDLGIVYVEPQADDTYQVVEVGKPLCDAWGVFECMGTVSSIQFAQCDQSAMCTKYTP
jgi:hypothetical protein